jgi:hypothetical protein
MKSSNSPSRLAAAGALAATCGFAAAAAAEVSEIGREVAVPVHLRDGWSTPCLFTR